METQVLHLDNGAPTTGPTRFRKRLPLIAGVAAFVILAAFRAYVVMFRSLPTTVTWAPSLSVMAPGGELAATGQVTPADSGRHVSIESAPNPQGPWQPMPQTDITDSHGRFAITFRPQLRGSILIRVVVDAAGRYLQVTGQPKALRFLSLSNISLNGKGLVTNQIPVNFTVAVGPPSVGRIVRIEQSSDKVRWVPVGASAQTQADGTTVVRVPGLAVGVWSYRATVAQDDTFAAAMSPLMRVTVEDIRVVAARSAAAHAKAAADQARQEKAKAERQATAVAEAARKAASIRPAPQYGYQCSPGDEKLYDVCAAHKDWVDGQQVHNACLAAGKTWDIATQTCP